MKKAEQLVEDLIFLSRDEVVSLIKIAQKDAIENTLTLAVENAKANLEPMGWMVESAQILPVIEGEDYEVYVVASSILDLKEQLFKEIDNDTKL